MKSTRTALRILVVMGVGILGAWVFGPNFGVTPARAGQLVIWSLSGIVALILILRSVSAPIGRVRREPE